MFLGIGLLGVVSGSRRGRVGVRGSGSRTDLLTRLNVFTSDVYLHGVRGVDVDTDSCRHGDMTMDADSAHIAERAGRLIILCIYIYIYIYIYTHTYIHATSEPSRPKERMGGTERVVDGVG